VIGRVEKCFDVISRVVGKLSCDWSRGRGVAL